MNEFDQVIGYATAKKDLQRIADILRDKAAYEKLGVRPPRGLLIHGEPGLGKTLMANCLIKASGRSAFVCRKDLPNGKFVNAIKSTFAKAKEAAPSIVFLDDMDKFANEDEHHKAAEEYITIQSCIDDVKDFDVFVLATANDLDPLPDSLLRAGRFDRIQELQAPCGEDALAIIRHYMSDKPFVAKVDEKLIARLMEGKSCAELETVINEAGLYAGFDRSDVITEKHFLNACMKLVLDVPASALDHDKKLEGPDKELVAYHEAGHAVVADALNPGCVSLMAMFKRGGAFAGITTRAEMKAMPALERQEFVIISKLAGKAAVEEVFGIHDIGAGHDLQRAYWIVERLIKVTGMAGLHLRTNHEESSQLKYQQEMAIAAALEQYYHKAKKILAANKEFLNKLAEALMENEVLTCFDVERIKETVGQGANVA